MVYQTQYAYATLVQYTNQCCVLIDFTLCCKLTSGIVYNISADATNLLKYLRQLGVNIKLQALGMLCSMICL